MLLAKGNLPPRGSGWRWDEDFSGGAYGVAYWVTGDYKAQFESLFQYLLDARGKSLEAEFPKLAAELLTVMEADGQQFFEQVCHTHKGNSLYTSVPILAAIDPKDFVAAWMRSSKPNWYWISNALQDRYKGGSIEEALKPEAPWVDAVVKLLNEETDKASGLAKLRLQRTIPNLGTKQSKVEVESEEEDSPEVAGTADPQRPGTRRAENGPRAAKNNSAE